jgi:TPR repeat protein
VLARKSDHGCAVYNLAKLCLHGCGVPKDVEKARRLYEAARWESPSYSPAMY